MSPSGLGYTAEVGDDPDAAERHHREALELALSTPGERASAPLALEGLAGVAAAGGRAEQAALLLGAADAARARGGSHLPGAERFDIDRASDRARSQLGAPRFAEAFRRSAPLGVEAAAALEEAGAPQP